MDHNPFHRRGKLRGRELLASPTKGQRRDLNLELLLPSLWDGAASLSSCRCCCCTSVVSDSVRPQRRQPTRLLRPGILQARALDWGAIAFSASCCYSRPIHTRCQSQSQAFCPGPGKPLWLGDFLQQRVTRTQAQSRQGGPQTSGD